MCVCTRAHTYIRLYTCLCTNICVLGIHVEMRSLECIKFKRNRRIVLAIQFHVINCMHALFYAVLSISHNFHFTYFWAVHFFFMSPDIEFSIIYSHFCIADNPLDRYSPQYVWVCVCVWFEVFSLLLLSMNDSLNQSPIASSNRLNDWCVQISLIL